MSGKKVCRRCGGSGKEPDLRAAGAMIRKAREAKGLGLREVASLAGCSPAYVSDIEHGRRNPFRGEKVRRVVQIVGADLRDSGSGDSPLVEAAMSVIYDRHPMMRRVDEFQRVGDWVPRSVIHDLQDALLMERDR